MNSSGGSVRSVSQKRSATQVAEPTASPAKSSASCLDQKVVSNVGNYVTSAARGNRQVKRRAENCRPARSGVAAGFAERLISAPAGSVRYRETCERRLGQEAKTLAQEA